MCGVTLPQSVIDRVVVRRDTKHVFDGFDPARAALVVVDLQTAFLPGASELPERLLARGFDTVLITGTVTNVCCESSARDAMMRNFRVVMVSDGNAANTREEHDASLVSLYLSFTDLMDTDMLVARLVPRMAVAAE